jgi:hypothetical protein
MAKITRLGEGAKGTNALEPDYFEQQEEKWAGKRSSASTGKPAKKGSQSKSASPQPVSTTARPSNPVPKASSSAASAGGSQTGKGGK